MSTAAVKKFGLRSLRSGAADQALLNLMSQTSGVPQAHHYQAIARALGHTSLTRVTLGSYIGPLGNLILDNSAVVFGEEEGVVGGKPDLEARVARLPQYVPFIARGVYTDAERAKREQCAVNHLPKLPPSVSMAVDVDPAVVSANRVRLDVDDEHRRAAWRVRLLSNARVAEMVPPSLLEEGREGGDPEVRSNALLAQLEEVTATHTRVCAGTVRRVAKNTAISKAAHDEGILLLRSFPEVLNKVVNLLQTFHSEREMYGKFIGHPASTFNSSHSPCRTIGWCRCAICVPLPLWLM